MSSAAMTEAPPSCDDGVISEAEDCFFRTNSSSVSTGRRLVRDESVAVIEIAVQLTILGVAVLGNVLVLTLVFVSSGIFRRYNARGSARRGSSPSPAIPPGFIGNGRRSLSRMNRMIAYLSCADLFVALFNVLPQLLWDITVTFRGNDALCRAVTYLQLVAMFASSYVLVATALDRYLAICRPLSALGSRGATGRFVAVAWIVSLVFSVPQLAVFSYRDTGDAGIGHDDCWAVFEPAWSLRAYITWTALAIYVGPAIALMFMYARICSAVWKSVRRREIANESTAGSSSFDTTGRPVSVMTTTTTTSSACRSSATSGSKFSTMTSSSASKSSSSRRTRDGSASRRPWRSNSASFSSSMSRGRSGGDSDASGLVGNRRGVNCSDRPSGTRRTTAHGHRHHVNLLTKAKIRTVKLTVTVNVSFVICWGPFFISHVWAAYDSTAPYEGTVMTITVLLASLNSCINPWIYIFFINNIRLTARTHLASFCRHCCCCCGSHGCESCAVSTETACCRGNDNATRNAEHIPMNAAV